MTKVELVPELGKLYFDIVEWDIFVRLNNLDLLGFGFVA